jgi:trans-aconitate 2-methyltransferase
VTVWDPAVYLQAADERARPFFDLLARVGAERPHTVVDLGCGPGNLTRALADRWPGAAVRAMDSSPDMVAAARASGVDAVLGDVTVWTPGQHDDVVVCNAVLQWVPGHVDLLREWVPRLAPGAWLAFQVPGNFAAPSHVLIRELAAGPRWGPQLAGLLRDEHAVGDPADYAAVLAGGAAGGCEVDAWETTYLHRLTGPDPVLRWVTGTALRPVRTALDDADWAAFTAELAPLLRHAYPPSADGTTWFPFRRIFAVAHIPPR